MKITHFDDEQITLKRLDENYIQKYLVKQGIKVYYDKFLKWEFQPYVLNGLNEKIWLVEGYMDWDEVLKIRPITNYQFATAYFKLVDY